MNMHKARRTRKSSSVFFAQFLKSKNRQKISRKINYNNIIQGAFYLIPFKMASPGVTFITAVSGGPHQNKQITTQCTWHAPINSPPFLRNSMSIHPTIRHSSCSRETEQSSYKTVSNLT